MRLVKIAVIGPGGVGGYFGGRLAQAGEEVTFVARGASLAALRTKGLRVESIKGDFTLPSVAATDDPSTIGTVDFVLVAVKAWQVPEVAATLTPLLGPETAVVPLENGLEAPDQLAAALGPQHVVGGLCAIVSFVVEPGHIRHAAYDPMVAFGELDNRVSARCERLRDALIRAGVNAEIPEDIHRSMWSKFMFIAPMSGTGAVTRVPAGSWRTLPESRAFAENGVREIVSLAAARGVSLGDDAVERTMARYDALAPDATASMQRDIMQGKPSELDSQIGAVVRMGRASGVATPVHDFMLGALLPLERIARGERHDKPE